MPKPTKRKSAADPPAAAAKKLCTEQREQEQREQEQEQRRLRIDVLKQGHKRAMQHPLPLPQRGPWEPAQPGTGPGKAWRDAPPPAALDSSSDDRPLASQRDMLKQQRQRQREREQQQQRLADTHAQRTQLQTQRMALRFGEELEKAQQSALKSREKLGAAQARQQARAADEAGLQAAVDRALAQLRAAVGAMSSSFFLFI